MAAFVRLMLPSVVLIPGNMCDARLWSGGDGALRSALTERGLAVADADTASDATIEGMARRTLEAAPGSLLVIGFSMGAIAAIEMARQAPERIAGLALFGPERIAGLALFGLNAGSDLPERAAARIRQQAEVRGGGLERVIVEELKPNYLAKEHRTNQPLLALLREMGLELGPKVFAAQSEALRVRADLRSVLDKLIVPVLLGCGADDTLCPPAWHHAWAERIADAETIVFPGAGHMLPLEQPEQFAARIARWYDVHQEIFAQ